MLKGKSPCRRSVGGVFCCGYAGVYAFFGFGRYGGRRCCLGFWRGFGRAEKVVGRECGGGMAVEWKREKRGGKVGGWDGVSGESGGLEGLSAGGERAVWV